MKVMRGCVRAPTHREFLALPIRVREVSECEIRYLLSVPLPTLSKHTDQLPSFSKAKDKPPGVNNTSTEYQKDLSNTAYLAISSKIYLSHYVHRHHVCLLPPSSSHLPIPIHARWNRPIRPRHSHGRKNRHANCYTHDNGPPPSLEETTPGNKGESPPLSGPTATSLIAALMSSHDADFLIRQVRVSNRDIRSWHAERDPRQFPLEAGVSSMAIVREAWMGIQLKLHF